jgi:hypothetical protein
LRPARAAAHGVVRWRRAFGTGEIRWIEETNMENAEMKRLMALVLSLALGQVAATSSASAAPGTASGPYALALAAVVAHHSPLLSGHDKRVIAKLFDGDTHVGFPANKKISVKADSIVCKVSDVDITARSCELTFASHKRSLKGREANEIFATLAAAGVASDGAAGSIFESVSKLVCTLDPNEIEQKAGGGAQCAFETGP